MKGKHKLTHAAAKSRKRMRTVVARLTVNNKGQPAAGGGVPSGIVIREGAKTDVTAIAR
jgi:hypothetical protein